MLHKNEQGEGGAEDCAVIFRSTCGGSEATGLGLGVLGSTTREVGE
jgi:hypothetical protein